MVGKAIGQHTLGNRSRPLNEKYLASSKRPVARRSPRKAINVSPPNL